MPNVSVIIPTYNRAEFVRAAINSVLRQTFQSFEVIVVDNGSTDHTKDIVQEFTDSRIKYLRIGVNNGVSPARNLGILHSSGKYVAFLDDDDEWLPEKLQLQVSVMENSPPAVGGVYTGLYKVERSSGSLIEQIKPSKRGNLFDELCIENCIGTASTVLLRKECVTKAGLFDENIVVGEEYDLWIRISREFNFECIDKPLVNYSLHMNNATMNYMNSATIDYSDVISGFEAQNKKYGSWFASNSKAYSERFLSLGVLYCYTGNTTKGREAFLKAIKLYPIGIRHYYNLGLSLLGPKIFKKLKELTCWLSLRLRESRAFICY
jgi:glycosyltransferase involved in cell wall biosynthesis